uniref:ionotropic receptor 170 precursor n=1 Tax=Aedes aegypti TaxID=7159 RepID=UPI000C23429E|nr:ionotropic receptor 170 precursor [Aedes aegypti]
MKFVVGVVLCITAVELISLEQFSNEVSENAIVNNYDAVFVNLNEYLHNILFKEHRLPKTIYNRSVCDGFSRSRVLLFMENVTDLPKNLNACIESDTLPIIFLRSSSSSTTLVQQSSAILRKLKINKALHVIYSPSNTNFTLIPYAYLRIDEPQSIAAFITPNSTTKLHGYLYKVHYKILFPFFYHKKSNGIRQIVGLDQQLTETIAIHQNASIRFELDPEFYKLCPATNFSIDFNTRRSGCDMISADRVHLPEWDAICVVAPKRHERLITQQFTKPFQTEVWILVIAFLIARFFFRFDRWRQLLLGVVLIEFMLTASYEVKVIQYMATLRYAPNPRTIVDLINRGEWFAVGPPEVDFLKTYAKALKMHVVGTSKEVYMGKAAMLYFCRTAEGLIHTKYNYNEETNDRIMILLPERLRPHPTSFGFVRSHPLRERFERMLSWVFETGIWRKIYDQFLKEEQQFQLLVAPNEHLIEFGDFVPLWMICGIGWVLSFLVFIGEMVWEQAQNRKNLSRVVMLRID